MTNAEKATLLAVGMNCPPPLCKGSSDILASSTLNLTFLMAGEKVKSKRELLLY